MQFMWTTLQVSDLDRSLAFYRDVLGFPLESRFPGHNNEIAMLGTPDGTKLELLCLGQPAPAQAGAGVSVGFIPDDIPAVLEKLAALGITPPPISPNPELTFYMVPDPDGYMVQLVKG